MDLQLATAWSDLVFKILSCAAIIVAGFWAYYQFKILRTSQSNIEVTVTTEVLTFSAELRMLAIHARAKNIGKVAVKPSKGGFIVTVRHIPPELQPGPVDLKSMKQVLNVKVLNDADLLEPGVEYDEVRALIVSGGTMYAVRAEMDLGDDEEVDATAIVRVD
jgi:hypothetical protein